MSILSINWIKKVLSIAKHKEITINSEKVPAHVAVIMDGNGRWAKQRGLPRIAGHHSGMKNIKKITILANKIGVKILTLYAFSTENWRRPQHEIDFLMKLPREFINLEIDELISNNVKVMMTGWKEDLPKDALIAIEEAIQRTSKNTGLILNIAINYGSRKEILNAIKKITSDITMGKLNETQLDENLFNNYLLTSGLPDPDLLIRTSGEIRLSNFLLWQLAYSELWFTEKLWPDFDEQLFMEAIQEYQRRIRRYGGV